MLNLSTILLLLAVTWFNALGAFNFKKAINKSGGIKEVWKEKLTYLGFVFYGFSTVLYLTVLRTQELSVVYPAISIMYLWTTILSVKYLGEKMNVWKWTALAGIILGITFIGFGA